MNITAKEEHVPEIERQNRMIKERARSTVQTLLYDVVPQRMKIALMNYVVYVICRLHVTLWSIHTSSRRHGDNQ